MQGSLRQLTENLHGPKNKICQISRVARGHKDVCMSPRTQQGTGIAKNYLKRWGECVGHLQPASPPQLSLERPFSQLHPPGGGQWNYLQPAMLLVF